MFAGHYAPSFAFKHAATVPLWVLFLAAQFVDILWAALVLAGVEKARLVPGITATSPLALDYIPYSHSLSATLVWGMLLGGLGSLVWKMRGGVVIGVCVVAHWFLDLLVHTPDLPLVGNVYKVGFGLWNQPLVGFMLEAAVLLGAVAIYARGVRRSLPFWSFALAMLGLQASGFVMPLPSTAEAFAAMSLANYLGFAAIAGFLERKWSRTRLSSPATP
jgi:hypothetical protein